jgi:hypothetical protein
MSAKDGVAKWDALWLARVEPLSHWMFLASGVYEQARAESVSQEVV